MKKSLFTIDSFGAIFEGYTDGQHWNGWACPWFTKEVADEIMRVNNESYCGVEYQMRYDEEQDAFIQDDGYDEPYVIKGYDIDGLHLYPVGNMNWIWDDLAEYQNEQTKKLMAYLQKQYGELNCEQLNEVYYGICQEIDGYMSHRQVQSFADGFMTAYGRYKK